jgi:hypothetical protein
MMDFSRVDFNKALSLNSAKKVEIESRYPLVKLGNLSISPQYGANEIAINGEKGQHIRYIRITDK